MLTFSGFKKASYAIIKLADQAYAIDNSSFYPIWGTCLGFQGLLRWDLEKDFVKQVRKYGIRIN